MQASYPGVHRGSHVKAFVGDTVAGCGPTWKLMVRVCRLPLKTDDHGNALQTFITQVGEAHLRPALPAEVVLSTLRRRDTS